VGLAGAIYRSTDWGQSWELLRSGTKHRLSAVFSAGEGIAYAAGDAGTILKTTDGGKSWRALTSGTTQDLFHLWGVTSGAGSTTSPASAPASGFALYAVGEEGTILKSTDGETWFALKSSATEDLYGVWGSSAEEVYAVGFRGLAQRSTDGGKSWAPVSLGDFKMYSVYEHLIFYSVVGSGADVWILGNMGALHSRDGGKSWTQVDAQGRFYGAGASEGSLYVAGSGGSFGRSTGEALPWLGYRPDSLERLEFYGAWGSASDDVYLAVGGYGKGLERACR
jgi:photosystem II stability/assembly factor-like uncharacterized protein